MSWLNFLRKNPKPYHYFGRGIDASLSKEEEELFNKSSNAFEQHNILDAYEYFLKSLINYTNDTSNQNIIIDRKNDKLNFILYQGTAKVLGTVTKKNLYAEVIIVKRKDANVALKRYILERNYQFTYISYFEDDEYIKLKT